jgi:hypothetical protein
MEEEAGARRRLAPTVGTLRVKADGAWVAGLCYRYGVAVDSHGSLFIAHLGKDRIRVDAATGVITTVAGKGGSVRFFVALA